MSSPILIKVQLDVITTMIADTLYWMLAQKLRGFEECDVPKLYRHFIRVGATVAVNNGQVTDKKRASLAMRRRRRLGGVPKTTFRELVAEMVSEDLKEAERDERVKAHGYRTVDHHE